MGGFRWARFAAALATLRCPEAWTLPPRVSRAMLRMLSATRPAGALTGTITVLDCPPLGSPAFRSYLRGLKRVARGERVPLVAHLAVTDRCPNRCARCSNLPAGGGDPPAEALTRLIAELRAAGTASLAFTGGEPCLRPDLEGLVAGCAPEVAAIIFTAGPGLSPARARELRSAGLVGAFVSLDHYRPEVHDRIRGRQGAFRESLAAIEACRRAGLYTAAQVAADGALLADGELEHFLETCRGLGLHDVVLLQPVPVRGPGPAPEFPRERLAALHRRAARDRRLPKVTALPFIEGPELLGCQAGVTFLYVNTAGEVFPCDLAPVSFGNVFELGLSAVLERMKRFLPGPSRQCLGLWLAQAGGARPLPWPQTEELMRGWEPGEPPELARLLLPARPPGS